MKKKSSVSLQNKHVNERGSAGVEFALVLPMMMLAFFGAVTVFEAIRASRMISQASTTVVDLVTRQAEMTEGSFDLMVATAETIVGDYAANSSLEVTVTSILNPNDDDDLEEYEVGWSLATDSDNEIETEDLDLYTLPTISEGDSIIFVLVTAQFESAIVTKYITSPIKMTRLAIRRPRFEQVVPFVDDSST